MFVDFVIWMKGLIDRVQANFDLAKMWQIYEVLYVFNFMYIWYGLNF